MSAARWQTIVGAGHQATDGVAVAHVAGEDLDGVEGTRGRGDSSQPHEPDELYCTMARTR